MSLTKKLSHCSCDKLTPGYLGSAAVHRSWFERLLLLLVPHFDIVKTTPPCTICGGSGFDPAKTSPSLGDYDRVCDNCGGQSVGRASHTVLYLRRFYLFRSRWLGLNLGDIYLHHIIRSDDDKDPHDHPWGFLGFVLAGGYTDEQWAWLPLTGVRSGPWLEPVRPLTVIYRPPEHIHRVIVPAGKTAWTLIFTSKYRRNWNFITQEGPVFWRKYLGIPENVDYGE